MYLVDWCIRERDIVVGRRVHSVALKHNFIGDSKLRCRLIGMYSSCGSIDEALKVFHSIQEQNIYSWSAIISAHIQHGLCEQVMLLYKQMQMSTVKPNAHTLVSVLKACASTAGLLQGKVIHSDIIEKGLESDLYAGSVLIDMYAKCGTVEDAHSIFVSLPAKDVVVWSALIAAYAQHGRGLEALQVFNDMQQQGIKPNRVTFVCVLKSCALANAISQGKLIHAELTKQKLDTELIVGNILVDMYGKCGSLEDALSVFDKMPLRDIVTWNAVISAHTDLECYEEAFHLLAYMQKLNLELNNATILFLLKLLAGVYDLKGINLIHANIIYEQVDVDVRIRNTLVDVYAKCGNVRDACKMFHELQAPDVVSWNTMLGGYADNGFCDEAFGLFKRMIEDGVGVDKVTYISILKACASSEVTENGKLIHIHIMKQGQESDPFIECTLIDMYSKYGCIEDARNVFDNISVQNLVAWNAIISGYADCGFSIETLHLFKKLKSEGVEPNKTTALAVLKACSDLTAINEGRLFHSEIIKQEYDSDLQVGNSLVGFYTKCGSLVDAHRVFNRMPVQDVVSWSVLLSGYADHAFGKKALNLFELMQQKGLEPNKVTFLGILKACSSAGTLTQGKLTHILVMKQGLDQDISIGSTLIDMYANCGSLIDAREIFDKLPQQNVVSWSAMIGGYAEHGHGEDALTLFNDMQCEGLEPNEVTYLCVLRACASLAALNQGELVHHNIIEQGLESNTSIGSTLVDMYAKSGSLEDALKVFNVLPRKDMVSWNAIIGAYADHGQHCTAHGYFEGMLEKGIWPNDVTFICLLTACSHAGYFREAYDYLELMIKYYGLSATIQHYACIIDMYGRSGCLEKAEKLVLKLPLEPNSTVYLSLLGACAKYKDVEIGRRVFDRLCRSGFMTPTGYVLMSNIYAANQLLEDTEDQSEMFPLMIDT